MNAKEKFEVMDHFEKGGLVSVRDLNEYQYSWEVTKEPTWNFNDYEYRIATQEDILCYTERLQKLKDEQMRRLTREELREESMHNFEAILQLGYLVADCPNCHTTNVFKREGLSVKRTCWYCLTESTEDEYNDPL